MPDLFGTVLVEASYEGVEFPVVESDTEGGHDAVEHTAYRRRGADIEPTGQQAYGGTLQVPLLNDIGLGELFPGRYYDLLRVFEDRPIGELRHPTKGALTVCIRGWKERLSPEVRNGVFLDVTWREHNATAGLLLADTGSQGDAPATVEARAAEADAEMAAADPTGSYTLTTPVVAAQLALLEGATTPTYAATVAALRTMRDVAVTNMALAAFATVSGYYAVRALADLRAAISALRSRYLPDTSRIRSYVVPVTMADWQVAQACYGAARYAPLVRQANALVDYAAIPAGTRLVILPPPATATTNAA